MWGTSWILCEFWKTNFELTNFELLAGNLEEMMEIWRKFLRNFGILNIFMKSCENFKKNVRKIFGVDVGLIFGKLWGNIGVILYY